VWCGLVFVVWCGVLCCAMLWCVVLCGAVLAVGFVGPQAKRALRLNVSSGCHF
jgi:hypothetical protein